MKDGIRRIYSRTILSTPGKRARLLPKRYSGDNNFCEITHALSGARLLFVRGSAGSRDSVEYFSQWTSKVYGTCCRPGNYTHD